VRVRGICFVGTRTPQAEAMAAFARDVLGLAPADGDGAAFFALADGSRFAVQATEELDPAERTVGFLVDDVAAAVAELAAAGVPVGEVESSGVQRYAHFRAPDGRLYELVEDL
jgi:catechol 2,3-dioxygenase-like lactoylglutathione lyase family enzyme